MLNSVNRNVRFLRYRIETACFCAKIRYQEYLTATKGIPIGVLVNKRNSGKISPEEEGQLDSIRDQLRSFNEIGSVLVNKLAIFGPKTENRFKSAKIYILLATQRLAVWKEYDFITGLKWSNNIIDVLKTLDEMQSEFEDWLVTKYIRPLSQQYDPLTGTTTWAIYLGENTNFPILQFGLDNKNEAEAKRSELIHITRKELMKDFFGEFYEGICSDMSNAALPA